MKKKEKKEKENYSVSFVNYVYKSTDESKYRG